MIKRETGFTLIELLIAMVMFVLVISAASSVFTSVLMQFKQQSKISETQVESIIGLEILRYDIEHAGYGLPWSLGVTYNETTVTTSVCGSAVPANYNDATTNPPRAISGGNNNCTNGSDYLVIKAVNLLRDPASHKWTHLGKGNITKKWDLDTERPETSDRVTVLTLDDSRRLITSSGLFTARYVRGSGSTDDSLSDSGFAPLDNIDTRVVYGITEPASPITHPLWMPFNRADYYYKTPASLPARCAPNTGVLYKATVDQGNGITASGGLSELPLIDCVADFQVDYWLDTDGDGDIDWSPSDNISAGGLNLTAQQIRDQVKEVRVYVVAQEGQKELSYDFSMGDTRTYLSATEVLGSNSRTINFAALDSLVGDPEYKYYRWKLYTLVVKPINIR